MEKSTTKMTVNDFLSPELCEVILKILNEALLKQKIEEFSTVRYVIDLDVPYPDTATKYHIDGGWNKITFKFLPVEK